MRQAKNQTQNQTGTEVQSMFEIVRIYRFETDRPLKAFVDVSVCNAVLIKGVRVLSNKEGELYISMPSEQAKDKRYYEVVKLLASETKQELQDVILAAYHS